MLVKTPRQFSILAAFMLSLLSVVIVELTLFLSDSIINQRYILIMFFVLLISAYWLVYYLLEKLITQKISLLYRTIHNFKINRGDFPLDMNEDVLGKTEKEVLGWVEKSREEIEKLRLQEEFRREFLGNLSHELKTPIFSIQGYILTLLEGGLEDENINRSFLERASKGVDRVTGIIEDLDVITKIESEELKLNTTTVNIVDLAKEIVESLEIKAQKRNVRLSLDWKRAGSPEINVLCDKDKIGQVLGNLINNSINYGVENGHTEVRFFDLEDNILIEVSDDGIGIKEEHLPRLFERFYRVGKSRARNEGGTGLGLAIVKHLVEAHGQTIAVRSTEGQGSTFSFTLKKL
jgi:two-component system phosphate regulon sensor histidine kinase PhoR|tara:strand:- start:887 stop:1933 length:1047 start_codon:yes stop_codon:yes gene_type:complete